ncbi:MAG TPA: Mur ligase family protein [Kofleriaceae bacterium]|jgi:dihydrofolate synthase/folylpolyglutamate synthase
MTYADVLARLVVARRFGMILDLERMRALLARLGSPEQRLGRIVHVAGTNGKGSTVAMVAALARAAGMRVATYTSPHLSCLRERIQIDGELGGELVGEAAFVAAAARVAAAGGDEYTFFEQVTAIGFALIADAAVDVSVIEVGLGGRLDSTNVVDPEVAVVTGVAMDHEAILGGTLAAIAGEKAGIFKAGRAAVIGASGEPAALPVLRAAAPWARVIGDDDIARVPPVSLPGAHQRRNAAAAIAAIEALGLPVVGSALARVVHPGRFEVVGDTILDGAHNPHGAAALAAELRGHPTLVIAVSTDKDVAAMAAALRPAVGDVIATRYRHERAMPPDELARYFPGARTAPELATALAMARGPRVIAGSLFLVGEARVILLGAPADPELVTESVNVPRRDPPQRQ